ncbi:MAG: hypothetical protein M3Q97_08940 [Bacteroidota bacterium]|nr:hypothetical protein [Bacteroidota bacterium]
MHQKFVEGEDLEEQLKASKPDMVVLMWPYRESNITVAAVCKNLGIPIVAHILGFDNISTKGRMIFEYGAYLCWSDNMKKELMTFYPELSANDVYVTGATQYDLFKNKNLTLDRDKFFEKYQLDVNKKLIVVALGSPNFLKEDFFIQPFLNRIVDEGLANEVQVLIRPHPGFKTSEHLESTIKDSDAAVVLQLAQYHTAQDSAAFQDTDEIKEWISCLIHSDIVINMSSTFTVDAAFCDKPIINLNFDSQPGKVQEELIKTINANWNHLAPINRTGGLVLANDMDEVIGGLRSYLDDPALHREGRMKLVDLICGYRDGNSAERYAAALNEIAGKLVHE